jgi:hypothetical protein
VPNLRAVQQISLTAAALLIVGCGGSTASRTTSATGSPAAAAPAGESVSHLPIANHTAAGSRSAHVRSAHAQFVAFAGAVNLRAPDVPGFKLAPDTGRKIRVHNKAFEDGSAYGRCFQVAKQARPLLKLASGKFASPSTFSRSAGPRFEQISSGVEVAASLAAARKELREGQRALADAAARRCLSRVFDTLGSQNQAIHLRGGATMRVTVGNFRMAPLSVAAAKRGTGGGFGFSMTLAVTYAIQARGRAFTFPTSLGVDVIGFAVGRATVTLTTMALGSSFPPGLEASSFAELVTRASAAARTYPDVLQ